MIKQLVRDQSIVDESGKLNQRAYEWTRQVTNLDIIQESGSPEGVIEAAPGRIYMDTSGTAGSILYIKRDADISGDRTQGWILV